MVNDHSRFENVEEQRSCFASFPYDVDSDDNCSDVDFHRPTVDTFDASIAVAVDNLYDVADVDAEPVAPLAVDSY